MTSQFFCCCCYCLFFNFTFVVCRSTTSSSANTNVRFLSLSQLWCALPLVRIALTLPGAFFPFTISSIYVCLVLGVRTHALDGADIPLWDRCMCALCAFMSPGLPDSCKMILASNTINRTCVYSGPHAILLIKLLPIIYLSIILVWLFNHSLISKKRADYCVHTRAVTFSVNHQSDWRHCWSFCFTFSCVCDCD